MKKTIKNVVKTGYGLGLLSLSEAKKVAGKVKKELKLNEKESLKLARELMANSEKASRDVLNTAGKYFEAALIKSGAASKREVKVVKKIVKKRMKVVKEKVQKKVKRGCCR